MKMKFSEKLKALADILPKPLYAVGGYVRNFLIDKSYASDIDLASPITAEELLPYLEKTGFTVQATYKNTGTVKFSEALQSYEFTSFRTESYRRGGEHSPNVVSFTDDIEKDATRRDFKCNAVYYDIKREMVVDPLGGINDISAKIIDTVRAPKDVFSNDGLRLMRLARFSAELGFIPTEQVIIAAKGSAENIKDISVERILEELKKILISDGRYAFSDKKGQVVGLKILERTGVFDLIFPEIKENIDKLSLSGKERENFYGKIFDVTLCVKEENRLFALFYGAERHIETAAKNDVISSFGADILKRLKADKKAVKKMQFLSSAKYVFDNIKNENKKREFIVENCKDIETLFETEYAVCFSDTENRKSKETLKKWRHVYEKMAKERVPFSLKQLKISANAIKSLGIEDKNVGVTLKKLQLLCAKDPTLNEEKTLKSLAEKIKKV